MTLLLDSHAFLWYCDADSRLSQRARKAIDEGGSGVMVSLASVWELTIKTMLGRLRLDAAPEVMADAYDMPLLPISRDHVAGLRRLPLLHGDPFDRLLVAQAQIEHMIVVTSDPWIARYDVPVLW